MSGITYSCDCRNLHSITSPIIDNNVRMKYGGTFSEAAGTRTFDDIGYGLEKTKYNKGYIYCSDASALFSLSLGYLRMRVELPEDIVNGVYQPVTGTDNEYLLWGVNVGKSEVSYPFLCAKLTKDGIKFSISSSQGEYSIIDNVTDISAEDAFDIEFIWDANRTTVGSFYKIGTCGNLSPSEDFWVTMCMRVNGIATVIGNPPISLSDSFSGLNFSALDTPFSLSNLECILKEMTVADTLPNWIIDEIYSSSSSSGTSSTSSSSSNLYTFSSQSDSSSTENRWNFTSTINDFIPNSIASSNTNSYIFVTGSNASSDIDDSLFKIYRSTDQSNWFELSSNVVSTLSKAGELGSRGYEIKCDPTGQYVLLGVQHRNPPRHTSNIGAALYSADYGDSWAIIISNVACSTTTNYDNGIANSLAISPVGQCMAIHAGYIPEEISSSSDDSTLILSTSERSSISPESESTNSDSLEHDRIFINNSYGIGTWMSSGINFFNHEDTTVDKNAIIVNDNGELSYYYHVSSGSQSLYRFCRGATGNWYAGFLGTIDNGPYYVQGAAASNDLYHDVLVSSNTIAYSNQALAYNPAYAHVGALTWGSPYSQGICNSDCTSAYFVDKTQVWKSIKGQKNLAGTWTFNNFVPTTAPVTNPKCVSGSRDFSHACIADAVTTSTCVVYYR